MQSKIFVGTEEMDEAFPLIRMQNKVGCFRKKYAKLHGKNFCRTARTVKVNLDIVRKH